MHISFGGKTVSMRVPFKFGIGRDVLRVVRNQDELVEIDGD